jgi:hypothetical protein
MDAELAARIRQVAAEVPDRSWYVSGVARETPTGAALLESRPEQLVDLVLCALELAAEERFPVHDSDRDHYVRSIANDLAASALRRKLPFTDDQLARAVDLIVADAEPDLHPRFAPINPLLLTIERRAGEGRAAPAALWPGLRRVAELISPFQDVQARKAINRIAVLVDDVEEDGLLSDPDDPWAVGLVGRVGALSAADRHIAEKLLRLAQTARGSRPTKAFGAARDELLMSAGTPAVGRVAGELLTAAASVRGTAETGQIQPELGDLLRGLAWVAGAAGGPEAIRGLGDMAVAGWRKVPSHGPTTSKAANAAIAALGELPEGAPQLGRIRTRLKQPAALRAVDAGIDEAAERLGIARAEFEERVVPDYGLDAEHRRAAPLGEHTAELRLAADLRCGLSFRDAAGKALKSTPAAVRRDHPGELAALKQEAKDITTMAGAQRIRLERLLLDDRSWTQETWRARYIDHGLVAALARRLIWVLDGRTVIVPDGEPVDVHGEPVSAAPDAEVRLWHPVAAPVEEVRTWRRFLEEREITQPFKQAHREIYRLTDAERQTGTYSNRFAAHVLRQHQMAALARGRGWTYALQGAWDTEEERVHLRLPEHDLHVAFWVERPWDSDDYNDAGVYTYILSDQVRFEDAEGDPVALDTVPERVFSEVMRDVDLFVGVTTIGNDPTWADQGHRQFQEYWRDYAFGELSEQAEVRRDVLERLLPKLVIADVARLEGRFLRVQGKRRAYKIHLGSGNIRMEPNDEYLCIVPGRPGGGAERVFLPFDGDQGLAIVLSKAFLLARDDEIEDETILGQIAGRG